MFINAPENTDATRDFLANVEKSEGFLMNFARAWAWRPDVFAAFAGLRQGLAEGSTLTPRDQAVMVCATAGGLGDAYCCLAWGRKLNAEAGTSAAAAVIGGGDDDTLTARDRALASWARKVAKDPNGTTSSDVDHLRDAGFNDREIFELTAFIGFRLAMSTINDALGLNPDWELAEQLPTEVRDAINFGRPLTTKPD
ncbi:MAG: hypothetical protein R3F22_01585 [Lysobacteraceae bacterium]